MAILRRKLLDLIKKIQHKRIMLLGDMVADVYLEGAISRISREAPVLILKYAGEKVVPGGAANAVHNAATLGGSVSAVGILGQDTTGEELSRILQDKGVCVNGLTIDDSRPTITKTRVMAGGQATVRQQVVRIDKEEEQPISPSIEEKILNYISDTIQETDALVMSDYTGVYSDGLFAEVIKVCKKHGKPCIVDSRYRIMSFKGVTVVKQNEAEAAAAIGMDSLDKRSLVTAGKTILDKLEAEAVLITRGPDGMTLFERGNKVTNIPVTNRSEVYDVTGAGDTVVAAMILALAAGASYHDAACLANFAAGVVVRKLGTATTDPVELAAAIGEYYEDNN